MYYVIETNYRGPNPRQGGYCDSDTIHISTEPATANSSGEVCTDGWCGQTNDWDCYAHGEYETLDEALAAIAKLHGENVREIYRAEGNECDRLTLLANRAWDEDRHIHIDEDDVVVFKIGKYEQWSDEATQDWVMESADGWVTAQTTDAELEAFFNELEEDVNKEWGGTLDVRAAMRALENFREHLREEDEEDEED